MKTKENIKALVAKVKAFLNKIVLFFTFKPKQLTKERYDRIATISQLVIMFILFICDYSILLSVNGIIAQYLLAANLLITANWMLYKLK